MNGFPKHLLCVILPIHNNYKKDKNEPKNRQNLTADDQ